MSFRTRSLLVTLIWLCAGASQAQDLMMGGAPTIGKGGVRGLVYPMYFVQSEAFSRFGLGLLANYGLAEKLDLQLEAVFNDDINFYYGGSAKYWLLERDSFDLSVFGGVNRRPQLNGLEAGVTLSRELRDQLDLYGGVDVDFGFADSRNFTIVNLDVGVEYELREKIHLYGEFSLGLGKDFDRFSMLGAGVSYFFQL